MFNSKSFQKFAQDHRISSLKLHQFNSSLEKKSLFKGYTTSPMVIEERQMNASTISVFDRLMMDRIIFLGEEIDDFVANVITAQLLFLSSEEGDKEPISLYINSPGGDCYSGLAIYDSIQIINCDVHTFTIGLAASMSFLLAVSGKKKHRYALRHSRFLLHQPLSGIGFSQASDIEIFNKEMQSVKSDLVQIIAKHTGQSVEKIVHDADRDYYLKGQEAVDYGVIDKILTKL